MRRIVVFCAVTFGAVSVVSATEQGLASFYGSPANGLIAAHRSLPLGTQVRVLNLDNGLAAVVRIVGRGPFIRGRVIDVSTAAAVTLGFREAGLAHVRIERILAATAEVEPRPERTSPYEICSYGAGRLDHLRTASGRDEAAASRSEMGCERLRSRLLGFVEKSEDFAPLVARGGAYLTEAQAAASIPVSALAGMADLEQSRTRLAASIPVSALAEVPERQAPSTRPARGCRATGSCGERKQPSGSSPALSFFARLKRLFD